MSTELFRNGSPLGRRQAGEAAVSFHTGADALHAGPGGREGGVSGLCRRGPPAPGSPAWPQPCPQLSPYSPPPRALPKAWPPPAPPSVALTPAGAVILTRSQPRLSRGSAGLGCTLPAPGPGSAVGQAHACPSPGFRPVATSSRSPPYAPSPQQELQPRLCPLGWPPVPMVRVDISSFSGGSWGFGGSSSPSIWLVHLLSYSHSQRARWAVCRGPVVVKVGEL